VSKWWDICALPAFERQAGRANLAAADSTLDIPQSREIGKLVDLAQQVTIGRSRTSLNPEASFLSASATLLFKTLYIILQFLVVLLLLLGPHEFYRLWRPFLKLWRGRAVGELRLAV
jgi:hypothetical protein